MLNTKPWWQSKTVWAALIAMVAGAVSLAGLELDAKLQDEIATVITSVAEIGAGVLALVGRIQAQSKLTWRTT